MARFAKPLQGSFSPVAKHPQKHKNRPEIGRFSHFNPSAEMHPFSLFSASKAPEKWLCDAICRKKQLFPTSRSGFLILHECLQWPCIWRRARPPRLCLRQKGGVRGAAGPAVRAPLHSPYGFVCAVRGVSVVYLHAGEISVRRILGRTA